MVKVYLGWIDFKNFIENEKLQSKVDYLELNNVYKIWLAYKGIVIVTDDLKKGTTYATYFEDNIIPLIRKDINEYGLQKVVLDLRTGSRVNYVSHDFTNKTTWWQNAIEVTGEQLTTADNQTYNFANKFIIDASKITDRDIIYDKGLLNSSLMRKVGMRYYFYNIYRNGTLVDDSEFSIDFANGTLTFNTIQNSSDVITADYYYAGSSLYKVSPEAGKILRLYRAEIQFSKGVLINSPIEFRVKLGDGSIVYSKIYQSAQDYLNTSNVGYIVPAFGGLTDDVIILPWDYPVSIDLKSSYGMSIEVESENDVVWTGEIGTVTLYFTVEDE